MRITVIATGFDARPQPTQRGEGGPSAGVHDPRGTEVARDPTVHPPLAPREPAARESRGRPAHQDSLTGETDSLDIPPLLPPRAR